jgi:hypothetical protein
MTKFGAVEQICIVTKNLRQYWQKLRHDVKYNNIIQLIMLDPSHQVIWG